MFDRFGEFDSAEEINLTADGLFNEGDFENIKVLARENGIDEAYAEMFTAGDIPVLCDAMTAAIGKLDVEAAELKPKEIMEDWLDYIKARCAEEEEMAAAVEKIAPEDTKIVDQEEKKGTNWEQRKQEEVIQVHKRSIASNLDAIQKELEWENWERVQNLAESIRWAAREIRDLKGDFEG